MNTISLNRAKDVSLALNKVVSNFGDFDCSVDIGDGEYYTITDVVYKEGKIVIKAE